MEEFTHILSFDIYDQQSPISDALRTVLDQMLCNNQFTYSIDDKDEININWFIAKFSGSYITYSIYNDSITSRHARRMLTDVIYNIKNSELFKDIRDIPGYNPDWKLTFVITRALQHCNFDSTSGQLN